MAGFIPCLGMERLVSSIDLQLRQTECMSTPPCQDSREITGASLAIPSFMASVLAFEKFSRNGKAFHVNVFSPGSPPANEMIPGCAEK
jgi:hypothetical protein